ncbi:MAG: hypothetical protein ABI634_04155 [Acidobacteriota bacterium]
MPYPAEFLEALGELGLAPRPDTPVDLVRDALNDLYRFELRRLRDRHRRGEVPKPQFIEMVVVLRKKYWLLTLPLPGWRKICEPTSSP